MVRISGVHIDFNGDDFEQEGILQKRIEDYIGNWEEIYGKGPHAQTIGNRFAYVLEQAHKQTGRQAVVLIDEYDKPILDVLDSGSTALQNGKEILLEDQHRNILKGFYSVFKSADPHLQFVLLTGVTKFSQVSVFSGFNQPKDLSMHPAYDTLCGITKDELYSYFAEQIQELAQKKNCTEEQIKLDLKRHYDGYHFSPEKCGWMTIGSRRVPPPIWFVCLIIPKSISTNLYIAITVRKSLSITRRMWSNRCL